MGDAWIAYEPIDDVDRQSARPDLAMLLYPWFIHDEKTHELRSETKLSASAPPSFIVQSDDGFDTPLSAVAIYTKLHQAKVSAELHIYHDGGYRYGFWQVSQPSIFRTWPDQSPQWPKVKKFAK